MIKLLLYFALFAVVLASEAFSQVRNTTFGMSAKEVISAENLSGYEEEEDNGILFISTAQPVAGKDAIIAYSFAQDQLIEITYLFQQTHSNRNDYISDFETIKDAITSVYGEPEIDDKVWKNDLFRDDRQEWGLAISIGHLVYRAMWKKDNMDIFHGLFGNNYSISHMVQYRDLTLAHLREKALEEQIQRDF